MAKNFKDLSEREILALAISLEEEDGRIYGEFAEGLRERLSRHGQMLDEMQAEESEHRASLIELYRSRFGEHIPLIRRQDVKGFVSRPPVWLIRADRPQSGAQRDRIDGSGDPPVLRLALQKTTDASTRKLLGDLAEAEAKHTAAAETIEESSSRPMCSRGRRSAPRGSFVLQIVQPGLAGLMDGSVSTLAPSLRRLSLLRKARTRSWWAWPLPSAPAFPWVSRRRYRMTDLSRARQASDSRRCDGAMTSAGGIGHTLPYLIADFRFATRSRSLSSRSNSASSAGCASTTWKHRSFAPPLQVSFGGVLVFLAGIFIGKS